MAELIRTDGTVETVSPKNGKTFSLAEMYELIGCSLVQVVYLADGRIMWLDEEGKFKEHYRNEQATLLLEQAGGAFGDYVAGNALICENTEVN